MPRLFLASSFNQTADEFVLKSKLSPKLSKVAFVQNAADPYRDSSDLFWVTDDLNAFQERGYQVELIDLNNYLHSNEEEINCILANFQIIHFCGGHTKYLQYLLHTRNFKNPLRNAILSNKLVMTGTSAGSMVTAPSLEDCGNLDDEIPSHFWPDFNHKHLQGLWLTDFLIIPHFNNPDHLLQNYETIKSTDYPYPIVFLSDNQALWVEDSKVEFIIV